MSPLQNAVLLAALAASQAVSQTVLHRDDFSNGLDQWSVELEKPGTVEAKAGALTIDVPAGATVWFKPELTGPLTIEYQATMIQAGGPHDRVSDLNCFWMATDARSPKDLFATRRTGSFSDYNQLRTYYVGQGGNSNTTTRFRRYIGRQDVRPLLPEHDIEDAHFLLKPNVPQTIRLVASGGRIQYWRDGALIFDFIDKAPYSQGHFAFRTTDSHIQIRGFRVYQFPYAWIPAGSFQMGCSPGDSNCYDWEKPAHLAKITEGFWIGETPVTVEEYRRFSEATNRTLPPEPVNGALRLNPDWSQGAQPMVEVTWDDAVAYCAWAGGRLPTEAEWEYAARAGSAGSRYDAVRKIAWFGDNSGREILDSAKLYKSFPEQNRFADYMKRLEENGNAPHAVGRKPPNAFGLYDMLGNVWQWTNDYYDANYYLASPALNPPGPLTGNERTVRGGSWSGRDWSVRVSDRVGDAPMERFNNVGFRCVRR